LYVPATFEPIARATSRENMRLPRTRNILDSQAVRIHSKGERRLLGNTTTLI
jgi:hypothetical protein